MSGAVGVRGVDRYQKSEVAKYVITMRDSLYLKRGPVMFDFRLTALGFSVHMIVVRIYEIIYTRVFFGGVFFLFF